jgi:rSAM/selenodomain-associated transferase 2
MKISVLMPAYNEASVIGATLAHVCNVLDPHELLVGNSSSRDATADIATAYAQVITRHTSRGAMLNELASLATGDVLLFVHADTLISPDTGSAITSALADPAVVGGAFRLRLDDPSRFARLVARSVNLRTSLLNTFFGDQAMFVRREVFVRSGGFQDWSLMEDLEILRRLRRQGRLQVLDAEVVTSARRHRNAGWIRTITTIWGICLLYRCGVPAQVLVRLYKPQR